jgi:O-antigen/teichoic acid export membrane protein
MTTLVSAAFQYKYTKWLPNFSYSHDYGKAFIRRFMSLWAIGSLDGLALKVTTFVFGLRFDAAVVGLLRAASRIVEALKGPVIAPITGMWFPLMAKVRGDIKKEQAVFLNLMWTAAFAAFPAFAGLYMVSDDLTAAILPKSFAGVEPIMRAMCVGAFVIPFTWYNTLALNALAMNKISLIHSAITVVGTITLLLVLDELDPANVILAMTIPAIITGTSANIIAMRRLKLNMIEFYSGLFPALYATFVMVCSVYMIHGVTTDLMPALRLCLSAGLGAGVFFASLFLFFPNWTRDRVNMLRGKSDSIEI